MNSVIVPLIKNKKGNTADMNNYKAIALSNMLTKIFESIIIDAVEMQDDADMYQFGFKHGQSTTLCTNVLKNVVKHYRNRNSHVFVCFIDFTKAFDRVNYRKLFNYLLDDGVNTGIVRLLAYWYSHQHVCVRWFNKLSESFQMSNVTRQGGILSPYFFPRYIGKLIISLSDTRIGCNIGGLFYNVLAYTDNLVLLTPSWHAMQKLLNVLFLQAQRINMLSKMKTTCWYLNL